MQPASANLRLLNALLLAAGIFAQTADLSPGDLKIVTTDSYESSSPRQFAWGPDTRTKYLHGQRFREDFQGYVGGSPAPDKSGRLPPGPHNAAIYQCDAKRVIELDLDAKLWDETHLDTNGFLPGSTYISAEELDSLLTKEEREKAAGALKMPKPTVKIVTDYVDTGERKEIYGFTARHIRIHQKSIPLADSPELPVEMQSDGWYVDLTVPWQCPTSHDAVLAKHHVQLQSSVGFHLSGRVRTELQVKHESYGYETHGRPEHGFPIEITSTSSQVMPTGQKHVHTSKQSSVISREPLDAALFEIPKDFARGKRSYRTGRMRPDTLLNDLQDWMEDLKDRISFYSARVLH